METQDPFLVSACEFVGIYTCVWTDAHVYICMHACACVCSHTHRENIGASVILWVVRDISTMRDTVTKKGFVGKLYIRLNCSECLPARYH